MAGPVQHFRTAVFEALEGKVAAVLCVRKGRGTLQLRNSDHVREIDKALLRGVLVGGVWNGFLLER